MYRLTRWASRGVPRFLSPDRHLYGRQQGLVQHVEAQSATAAHRLAADSGLDGLDGFPSGIPPALISDDDSVYAKAGQGLLGQPAAIARPQSNGTLCVKAPCS
jgi:hypothetical protein